ncbi:MAG: glycosyltransferase family 4 protein [Phyllobacterium sp.]
MINGRFLAQPMTGVQRYAHEIVRGLDRLVAEEHALARDLEFELLVPPEAKTSIELDRIPIRPVGSSQGHRWEQTVLPLHAQGGLLSLCNTGPVAVRKQIVCIHDVNTRAFPQSYSRSFRSLYRVLLPLLGKTARQITTVSHYSASELVRLGICGHRKLAVVPNGHEHALRWVPQHSAATRLVAGPNTIVVIGSSIPHKNIGLIVGLAGRLTDAGLKVAVVGMSDARVFSGSVPQAHNGNIHWLGRLPDDALAALLHDSMCLAFPSFVEGFGLPPLEAMALGCPVIASDRASLPEICADAALYAPPDNPDAWFDNFVRLHNAPLLRASLITRGRARLAHYRWQASAERYLEIMAQLDRVHAGKPMAARPLPLIS